ncbi:hypothetical protein GCM10027347_26550 [Larkinella harenae]
MLLLFRNNLPGLAQSFAFRAELPAVQQAGYYRILLPPAVIGKLKQDRSDIRLYNEKQQEVPYLLTQEQPVQTASFTEYELISRQTTPGRTTLVLRNPAKQPINSLGLTIKNTNLRKKARLSGSNNRRQWYGIEDDYVLQPVTSNASTSEVRILGFPLSDYEYYKLDINDSLSAPLNILKVGFYTIATGAGSYSEIPGSTFSQSDSSNHKSYLHLRFPSRVRPDRLTVTVAAPTHYRRRVEVVQRRTVPSQRHRPKRPFESLKSFELNSNDSLHTVELPPLHTDELVLIVHNQNNLPLVINTLSAQQLTTYMVAELNPKESYHLAFSNPDTQAPGYDLVYFKDKIPASLPILSLKESIHTAQGNSSSAFFQTSWLIWAAIGLVIGFLSYYSYRMVKEMKNS